MSVDDMNSGGPIQPGSPLARMLDDFRVPDMSADFADSVVAAAATHAAPLPPLRQPVRGGGRGWRLGRRIVIGAACFSALATAAAATGLLEKFDIPVPSPEKVWASLTGKEPTAAARLPVADRPAEPELAAFEPVIIEGQIDTPEELGEVFRRIDEVRGGRRDARRQLLDQRIDRGIERRRAAGLPVPTPEEEARLRQRIDEAQARREQISQERTKLRREELERKVEKGETLTREDIVRPVRDDERAVERRERLEQLRQMSPEQRREAMRQLPPEQRRALIEQFRARRSPTGATVPEISPDNAPSEPASDTAPEEVESQPPR